VTHIVEVEFPAMDSMNPPLFQISSGIFNFSRRTKSLRNYFRATFSFETRTDSVPVSRLEKHRNEVEDVWQASLFRIRLPVGYAALKKSKDFGTLPRSTRSISRVSATQGSVSSPAVPKPVVSEVTAGKLIAGSEAPKLEAEKIAFIDPRTASKTMKIGRLSGSRPRLSSRRHGSNRKCSLSLRFLGIGILGFAMCFALSRIPGTQAIGGFILLGVFGADMVAVCLAILGLQECQRYPERFRRGKASAIITLAVSRGICLFFLIVLLATLKAKQASTHKASKKSVPSLQAVKI
jgi:hypothetical protein